MLPPASLLGGWGFGSHLLAAGTLYIGQGDSGASSQYSQDGGIISSHPSQAIKGNPLASGLVQAPVSRPPSHPACEGLRGHLPQARTHEAGDGSRNLRSTKGTHFNTKIHTSTGPDASGALPTINGQNTQPYTPLNPFVHTSPACPLPPTVAAASALPPDNLHPIISHLSVISDHGRRLRCRIRLAPVLVLVSPLMAREGIAPWTGRHHPTNVHVIIIVIIEVHQGNAQRSSRPPGLLQVSDKGRTGTRRLQCSVAFT